MVLESTTSSCFSSLALAWLADTAFRRVPASYGDGKGGSRVDLSPRVVTALTFSFEGTSGCPGSFPVLALGQDEAS
jgi:hypothetical protein